MNELISQWPMPATDLKMALFFGRRKYYQRIDIVFANLTDVFI